MKMDISDLLNKEIFTKKLDIVLKEDSFYDGKEYSGILTPIMLLANLEKTDHMITLNGKVSGVLELTCSRCLKKFAHAINININERFTDKKIVDCDEDIFFINDGYIDITQIIENNIILALPIKRLCKENCKGLCPKCGTNLNDSTCNCKENDIDPRWEKLKDMFSK
ncbi:DUF177 domain-containing protein [Clostridium tyrobutyricum]|uniref:YceD family protein n=1 Tax=Clostridium tyrobutyricum TaxID=1519 RepID=UPI001C3883A9|nr:DUF177 domain-containing protein [Clostridium tyrobutyricum]MBV4418046.1 DUF177 domain-containing protein [Clostridium tyrobutyricum]